MKVLCEVRTFSNCEGYIHITHQFWPPPECPWKAREFHLYLCNIRFSFLCCLHIPFATTLRPPCCGNPSTVRRSGWGWRWSWFDRFTEEFVFRHTLICLNELVWSIRLALVLHEYKLFFLQVNKPRGENNVWLCTMQKNQPWPLQFQSKSVSISSIFFMTTVIRLIHLRRGRCPRIGELSWFNRCCLVLPSGWRVVWQSMSSSFYAFESGVLFFFCARLSEVAIAHELSDGLSPFLSIDWQRMTLFRPYIEILLLRVWPCLQTVKTRSSPDVRSVTCSESTSAAKLFYLFTNPGAQTEKRTQLTTGEKKPHQHQILFFRSLGRSEGSTPEIFAPFLSLCCPTLLEMRITKLFFQPNCFRYQITCHLRAHEETALAVFIQVSSLLLCSGRCRWTLTSIQFFKSFWFLSLV